MKVVLITGSARRVGAIIARAFHSSGYKIIVHYNKSRQEAEELSYELNAVKANTAAVVQSELSELVDNNFSLEFKNKVLACFGKVDVLVNNASSFFATEFGSINLEMWRDLMASNAGGPLFLSQLLAEELKANHGAIINISDIHAKKPLKNYSVYSIAKAANNMVTKTLANELAPFVRVNGVAPGPILWPESPNLMDEAAKAKVVEKTLLKKPGSPKDIADAVLFFAESNYITGQVLAVDGGRSINN